MELGNMIFGNSRGNFEVNRDWVNIFSALMDKLNMEYHCSEYENDTFIIFPYYWGEDEEIACKPNFVYKPTGFKIDWYKYPFRDSYMNQNISKKEFMEIILKCIESVK